MLMSVCIVGAGPAGLVAAKTLLQTGKFSVTIFEKGSRIGGIWALDEQSKNGYLSPYTPTNLSRFTVGFSDLAWESVLCEPGRSIPMFPRAWQVNRYLETYCEKYIRGDIIQLNTVVLAAARSATGWTIVTQSAGIQQRHHFDNLIMASGFFAAPRPLEQNVSAPERLPVKAVHSTQFKSLGDLYPDKVEGNILIIGGGNSAGEAAGVVASQLSNTQWQPDKSLRDSYKHCKIVHVVPRPLYAMPPFVPLDDAYRRYLPLDFGFYNLAKRLPGPIEAGGGISTKEFRDLLHAGVQSSLGGDQSDLGAPALVNHNDDNRGTVQVALTETYSEFVRSGLIDVVKGRVESLTPSGATVSAILEGSDSRIDDIGAVLYATGYSPIPALDFLDAETQKALHYDANSMRLPMILDQWQTSASSVPNLAFHGFYEGPYWGVMEMQARVTAQRWLGNPVAEQRSYETADKLLALRQAMADKSLEVPQYWLGDYLGYMEEIAFALNLRRNDGKFAEREGISTPARYLFEGDDQAEAVKTMADTFHEWHACHEGRYVPRAAFRALHGKWSLHRTIDSRNSIYPSGQLTGEAHFHPRTPTADFDLEYVYVESGTFKTNTGATMNASRRYVYRYSEARDELSVWFVKPDSDLEADYLFHNLSFSSTQEGIVAQADHLCVKDMYKTTYKLPLKGIALQDFVIEHEVHGPEKNYTATSRYVRPTKT